MGFSQRILAKMGMDACLGRIERSKTCERWAFAVTFGLKRSQTGLPVEVWTEAGTIGCCSQRKASVTAKGENSGKSLSRFQNLPPFRRGEQSVFQPGAWLLGYDCKTVLMPKKHWFISSNNPDMDLKSSPWIDIGGKTSFTRSVPIHDFDDTRVVVITAYPRIAEMWPIWLTLFKLSLWKVEQLTH